MTLRKIGGFLLPVLLWLPGPPAAAQELLYKIEGHTYEHRSFDPHGELKGRERIEVGELRHPDDHVVTPIEITIFEVPQGTVKQRIEMKLSAPDHPSHVLHVLAFLGRKDKSLEMEVTEKGDLYPEKPHDGQTLPDLTLRMRLEKGFLSFLGAGTKVRITDRTVHVLDSDDGAYEIRSRIRVQMRALGIGWKTTRFDSRQVLDPDIGLVLEGLRKDDGAQQVIERLAPSSAASGS